MREALERDDGWGPNRVTPRGGAGPLFDGPALKDRGIARVSADHAGWLEDARRLALYLADQQGTVTADDLRGRIELPPGAHRNLWGAVWNDPRFKRVGYRKAQHPDAHARVIAVWSRA